METGIRERAARAGVSRWAYFLRGVAACILSASFLGLVVAHPSGRVRDNRPSIVLIVVDTLRADRLSREQNGRPLMPHVRRLGHESTVYDRAGSAAPMTMPSVAALLTGLYPDHAGVVTHSRGTALDGSSPTLAEIARAGGYATSAIVANPWLASPATRFNRGFESYATKRGLGLRTDRLEAGTVTDLAVKALQSSKQPLFLWVHYIDTHMPYRPPPADAAALGNSSASSAIVRDYVREGVDRQMIYFAPSYASTEIDATRTLYDASARAVDREVGRLLEAVDRGLGHNVIVIFTADHGESLGEHGLYFAHDFTLYDELTHVPLLVRLPGRPPARVHTPVSLIDVLPTICASTGLRCPDALDGTPLPATDAPGTDVYSVGPPYRKRYDKNPFVRVPGLRGRWCAVRRGDRTLIRIPTDTGLRWEAYDLAIDPGETRNVFDSERDADLARDLNDWASSLAEAAREGTPRNAPSWRRNEIRDLRALGYLD